MLLLNDGAWVFFVLNNIFLLFGFVLRKLLYFAEREKITLLDLHVEQVENLDELG